MKIKKEALLFDISNIAFVIADNGDYTDHRLHRVRDICEEGNISRVSRVLGLAYSNILVALLPLLEAPRIPLNKDFSEEPHDYEFCFRKESPFHHILTKEIKLKIKETAHEYMVAMVLFDWLGITFPTAADVWKFKSAEAFGNLKEMVSDLVTGSRSGVCRRKLSPF